MIRKQLHPQVKILYDKKKVSTKYMSIRQHVKIQEISQHKAKIYNKNNVIRNRVRTDFSSREKGAEVQFFH